MLSKTLISRRTERKTNSVLVDTINEAKKLNLLELAKKLTGPTRQLKRINLDQLENIEGSKIMIVGKVLGSGDIKRKISVSALGFSEQAMIKLKKAGCETKTIKQEIHDNPKMTGVKII